ncbi:MAG: hypothetical protein Q8S13_08810 [Dehalococcoidia bacterium]|nr:hypothetical protein [Dehalococcoidia bacterium]
MAMLPVLLAVRHPEDAEARETLQDFVDHLEDYEVVVCVAVRKDGGFRVVSGGCAHTHHIVGALEEAKLYVFSPPSEEEEETRDCSADN